MSSEWTWPINNMAHTHNVTGFWGPVEANHAFCEPHYAVSPYIAEFFNSTSSLIFMLVALFINFPTDPFIQVSRVWLLAIGLGSMLFHGTMRYEMQLADEIPMVGFVTTLMIAKISMPHPWLIGYIGLANALVIFVALALIGIYVIWDEYEIFIHGFTLLVIVDSILNVAVWQNKASTKWEKLQTRSHMVGFFAILLGRVAWESEHYFCVSYPSVWPLHVVWHLLSCTSAYGSMTSTYVMRAKENAKMPRLIGFLEFSRDKKIHVD